MVVDFYITAMKYYEVGRFKEAAELIRDVIATTGGEEAYDIYSRYALNNA
ncbi:MAG: hypothetical protein PHQ22_08315 [Sulfuricurvum sp.]|nr:hypothetical protein [Sulfuricurvum sp.]MDD5387180.1 hypothetical protein [Sulfuricurvum sp.]